MSLKGYKWLRDDKAIMGFSFKDLEIYLWDDVSEKEYNEFTAYIKKQGFEILKTELNGHKIWA